MSYLSACSLVSTDRSRSRHELKLNEGAIGLPFLYKSITAPYLWQLCSNDRPTIVMLLDDQVTGSRLLALSRCQELVHNVVLESQ